MNSKEESIKFLWGNYGIIKDYLQDNFGRNSE
jgi:hypothetical protein